MASRAGSIDAAVVAKVQEIRSQPYARYIVAEDGIERNTGYKIIRQQVAAGKNSMVYRCETAKRRDVYCVIKRYKYGKERIREALHEETCQIMRHVSEKCAQLMSTFDIFYTSEKIYVMCDWSARGLAIDHVKQQSIRVNERLVRDWTIDILAALQFLHSNAICHRNISPSCLLLTADNRVKIGSLSDAVIYCTLDGALIKQKWNRFSDRANWNQPPEVAKGKPYDPRRADIWMLGATIFWFITRLHPIEYKTNVRMSRHLTSKLAILDTIRQISPKCREFVKKVLTFQPPERPKLQEVLQMEWVAGEAAAAGAPSSGRRDSSVSGRTPPPLEGAAGKNPEPPEAAGPEESPAPDAAPIEASAGTPDSEAPSER